MNPFEDENGRFVVLVNHDEQHSIWPTFAAVPEGWTVAFGEHSRQDCLRYVEEAWTDMRPRSLRETSGGAISRSLA